MATRLFNILDSSGDLVDNSIYYVDMMADSQPLWLVGVRSWGKAVNNTARGYWKQNRMGLEAIQRICWGLVVALVRTCQVLFILCNLGRAVPLIERCRQLALKNDHFKSFNAFYKLCVHHSRKGYSPPVSFPTKALDDLPEELAVLIVRYSAEW
jgi:hypothetical protein